MWPVEPVGKPNPYWNQEGDEQKQFFRKEKLKCSVVVNLGAVQMKV